MSPTNILFDLAGSPQQEGCEPVDGRCRVCAGEAGRGVAYHRWQGSSFTSQDKLRDWAAENVCEPCVWAHAWNVPPGFPPPEAGKKGVNLRLYSHCWDERVGYHAWNKANKAQMRAWLREPKSGPWFAAIADTGQKHVLPWTPLNHGARGVVRFEELDVRVGSHELVDAMCALLTAGATKEEIQSAQYGVRAWQLAPALIDAFESDWGRPQRGGGWFSLALWLAQRDEEKVAARQAAEKESRADKAERAKEAKRADKRPSRTSTRSNGTRAARDASGVLGKRSQSSRSLGPDPDASDRGIEADGERGRVDDDAREKAESRGWQQGSLFD